VKHRTWIRWNALAPLAVAMLAALTPHYAHAIEVLLLWDDSPNDVSTPPFPPPLSSLNDQTEGFVNALLAAGLDVTLSDTTQYDYNGDNPSPNGFDVIVHLNGNIVVGESDNPIGDAVAVENFIKSGGGYVGSENNGRQINDIPAASVLTNFTPVEYVSSQATPPPGPLDINFPAPHPIFTGLTSPFTINGTFVASQLRDYSPSPQLATELATDDEGNTAVAVREFGTKNGRIVGFHHRGNYEGPGDRSTTLSDANVRTLYINAIRWADQTPPKVKTFVVDGAPASNAATADFLVTFSESVTGVDAADFALNAIGVSASPTLSVTAVSDKQYRVSVSGISGAGLLGVNLVDDDSIVDESSNLNALATASNADGSASSTLLNVDRLAPSVQAVSTLPDPATTGTTPLLSIEFDEPMKNNISPVITVTPAANEPIDLEVGGNWSSAATYQVALDRALTNADAGAVTVTVSGAQDFLGNAMNPYSDTPITFSPIGLSAVLSLSGNQVRTVGESITFEVSLQGLTGIPHFEWKKDTSDKAVTTVGTDSPELTLSNLSFTDTAEYYCLVTDDVALTQTPPVQLTVVAALPLQAPALLAAITLLTALGGATLRRKK